MEPANMLAETLGEDLHSGAPRSVHGTEVHTLPRR